jgi:hypothetical protein
MPGRHPLATLLAIGVLFAAAYGSSLVLLRKPGGQIVVGDALNHYVQLRSIVFDRDLQFRNEYARLHGVPEEAIAAVSAGERMTPTDHIRNYMPFGPALLWAPLFLLVTALVWCANLFGAGYPLDGYARLFQATAGFSGIAAACAGSVLAYAAAARLVDRHAAIWATLAVWLSSSALYYSLVSPTYSHAASMFAVSAFWLAWTGSRDRQTPGRYATVGALAGLAALMRWQDAILLLIPIGEAAWRGRDGVARTAARAGAALAAAALAFTPQMAVWGVLYGSPLVIPQGSGFMRWSEPALWAVLFSDNHGLFSWTPIVLLSVAGLVPLARREPVVGVAGIGFVLATWYVNAAVADWWGGEAFGARRFISCYPVFVLGLATLFADVWRSLAARRAVTVAFTAYTLLLLLQYQAFMHGLRAVVPYPRGFVDLYLWRFRAPVDLLRWWLER